MPERSLEIPSLDELRRVFGGDAPRGDARDRDGRDGRDGDDAATAGDEA
jgi:hypothetical protein